jgi:CheY-like chemotaxis protein
MAADLLPDIVLMDLRMPRCDGVEATRLLRERVPQTKVVVLTTYADDRSVIKRPAGWRTRLPDPRRGRDRAQAVTFAYQDGLTPLRDSPAESSP